MDALVQYSIPVKGLRDGIHEFKFHIDRSFFECFESSPVEDGNVEVTLEFEKRPGLYVLTFELEGTVRTECDRCLAPIDLPIADEQRLLVKFSEEEEREEAEVIFISPEMQKLNVAKYIYEYIVLAMPLIKVYDCRSEADPPCNEEMLAFLNAGAQAEEEETENPPDNPIWDELKKLNSDN